MRNRILLGLGVIGLALVGAGTVVFLTRDTVSKNLIEAYDTRAERAQATLFRWGELGSIGAELKDEYGAEPDVTYDTSTRSRILQISFSDYPLPTQVTADGHAREIAAFAVGKTTKFNQIDVVEVRFQNRADGSASYTFALSDLMPTQPRAKHAVREGPAAE